MSHEINIVIPMAGAGSRFAVAGYDVPKLFIKINGRMMIQLALDGVRHHNARYTLIIQQSFLNDYPDQLRLIQEEHNVEFITVAKLTQGATCTVLAAHELINNSTPLLICDCDNIINNDTFTKFLDDAVGSKFDGSLITFNSSDAKFSFAKTENHFVVDIKEKEVISSNAIGGFYFISHGCDFIKSAINTIIYCEKTNNEFYISSVCDNLIKNGKQIVIYNVDNGEIDCVGTPEQLNTFIQNT